jgi:succinoglycan biosynthesis transport protein ExoP
MTDEIKSVSAPAVGSRQIDIIRPSRVPAFDLSPREPHLYDYLLILRKHQWMILSFMLAVVTIVSVATFRMHPIYVANAKLEIDRENSNILPFQGTDSYDYMMDMDNYIETQSRILTSETMALQTIRNSGLASHPDFSNGGAVSEAIATGSLANQKRPPEVAAFLGSLGVKRIPNSRLMEVSFESTDPVLAARILNAHLENYKAQNIQSRYDATAEATNWLASQLSDLKLKVEKSENDRINYERQNQIWSLDNDKNNMTTQRLSDLNKELTDAESETLKKRALYEYAESGALDAVPQIRDNSLLQDLQRKRAELSVQYTDAVNQYGPNFPKVLRIQAQMKDLEEQMTRERKGIIVQLKSDYDEAKAREDLLNGRLDQQKLETNAMSEKMVQYNILRRDADANKALYEGLLTKLKEAGISAGLKSSNIRIVDPAMIPSSPSRPAKARNISLAFLVGLIGGIGLALLREYLDNTVKTPDDVETLSRLPSLAVVPMFADAAIANRKSGLLKGVSSNGSDKRIELVAQHLPKSQMAEAFRALRTALLLSQADHPPQVILVTSALPREGKTTAAANLAVTLAQLGDKTVLVDADLRKPGIGRLLNLGTGKFAGLSSYLAGASSLDLVTVPHAAIPNLAAIPTGPLPPNPADLLSSHRLADAIAELRTKFKFIVIDSPPIMAATDAVILSVQADGVLLVVRSGETPKEAFTRSRDLLTSVKSNLLGVVLNAVDSSSPDYYYSYRYYPYSYGYGPQEALELAHAAEDTSVRRSAQPPDMDDSQKL